MLAGVVLALGIAMAVPIVIQSGTRAPRPRVGDVGFTEAVQSGPQPAWVAIVNPFLGAAGVVVGGRLWGRKVIVI